MMRPLSRRERRLVALLILAGLAALLWYGLVAPIAGGFANRAEQRAQLRLRYAHNVRTIALVPRLGKQAAREAAAAAPFRLAAPGVEQGRDALKDRLQRAVEAAAGEFRDVADVDGRPGWLRARVTARLTLSQLNLLLGQLQNNPPWLAIESLSISANDSLVTGQSSTMDVQLEASVPFRPAAARPAAAR
jgi:hypothetical protein